MKNTLQKLTLLMVTFLVVGCNQTQSQESSISSSSNNEHHWAKTYSYDEENHWLKCNDRGCEEISEFGPHEFGEWENVNQSSLSKEVRYSFANVTKKKSCKICGYSVYDGTNILPELRFTSDVASEISFATTARKDDIDRPEVKGKITIGNCSDEFKKNGMTATMKVRGNQTANWSKKAFRIKFDSKTNLFGLNGGKKFKKWVLFADAKDTTLIRSATGLYIAKAICKDQEDIWVSDFTPVSVYLNDKYWGYYYLAEQKEVKDGRVKLEEPAENYAGTDIGYCFELDYYASDEPKKSDGGDPTFKVTYSPEFSRNDYKTEGGAVADYGAIRTYTLLSDITDSTAGTNKPINENNSEQVAFIKKRVESLYTILYNASKYNKAQTIVNNEIVDANDTVENAIKANFDLDTFADGFILNAFDCAPDLGYSSFYMSFDNTPNGKKKLRYDVPWDFDSNFGNRNGFISTADTASSGGGGMWGGGGNNTTYDPYYMDRTSNMWISLLSKLDFFIDIVKVRWNQIREDQAFENMFHMMRTYFSEYDAEIQRNHARWPTNDASYELRSPFKNVSEYKQAQEETINWCAKRINYLEKKWGNGRSNVNTNM